MRWTTPTAALLAQETYRLIWCRASRPWSTAMNFYGRRAARGGVWYGGSATLQHCRYRPAGWDAPNTLWCTTSQFRSSLAACRVLLFFFITAAATKWRSVCDVCTRQVFSVNCEHLKKLCSYVLFHWLGAVYLITDLPSRHDFNRRKFPPLYFPNTSIKIIVKAWLSSVEKPIMLHIRAPENDWPP